MVYRIIILRNIGNILTESETDMGEQGAGRLQQVKIYTGKCFRTFKNEKGWKSFISTLLISLILAWIIGDHVFEIYESTRQGVFALICGCIWIGLFNSIQSICRERAIIKREHRTGLHISSYIVAHLIFEFAQCFVQAVILNIVFDIFRDFPKHGVIFGWTWFEFLISFTLIIFAADAIGIMVSCIVKNENTAMTVMPFVLIIQLVLSGLMFAIPDGADFVKELTISKWGVCSICSSANINDLPSKDTASKLKEARENGTSGTSLKKMGIDQEYVDDYAGTIDHVFTCWLVLIGYSALYSVIGFIFLKQVDRDKR